MNEMKKRISKSRGCTGCGREGMRAEEPPLMKERRNEGERGGMRVR